MVIMMLFGVVKTFVWTLTVAAVLCEALLAPAVSTVEVPDYPGNPVADPEAVVTVGAARFTVLTEHLVRIEWASSSGNGTAYDFEDRQTMKVWNRALPVPASMTVTRRPPLTTVSTSGFVLTYHDDGQPLNAGNLRVEVLANTSYGGQAVWRPGANNRGNLFGTFHTWDGLDGVQNMNCEVACGGNVAAAEARAVTVWPTLFLTAR